MDTTDQNGTEALVVKDGPIKKYKSTDTAVEGLRPSKLILPTIRPLVGNESGIAVTTYGQGQVTGGMYTVPAHAEIKVDFKLRLLCITPEDVQMLSDLIKSLLDASRRHSYEELSKTSVSGGASFFGMFGWGGARASYEQTKRTMDSFGLSERNQEAIVDAMMKVSTQLSEFNYSGTIYNRNYDYDVSGNLFGIVMDAEIQQGQYQRQSRFLAPNVHLSSPDGVTLPTVGQLYNLQN
jgi:hypothetical protein